MSFGWVSKYVIWSGVLTFIWLCDNIYHKEICHLVGGRNMSFGRASKYVILYGFKISCLWSSVEICHLVGGLKYVIWCGIEICLFVGRRNMSFGRESKLVILSGVKI